MNSFKNSTLLRWAAHFEGLPIEQLAVDKATRGQWPLRFRCRWKWTTITYWIAYLCDCSSICALLSLLQWHFNLAPWHSSIKCINLRFIRFMISRTHRPKMLNRMLKVNHLDDMTISFTPFREVSFKALLQWKHLSGIQQETHNFHSIRFNSILLGYCLTHSANTSHRQWI